MTRSDGLSEEDLDALRSVDTPTVCNVIELFDVRPRNVGFMDARIGCCYPELPPMVGYAATATFRSDAPPSSSDAYGSLDEQIARFAEIPGPPVVVFQDLDDPAKAATFGEIMCATYRGFGAAGLITSGAGRDLIQVRALDFPVFTGGTISAHGYCHILQLHVPVSVGGMTIRPGDLLHGDANGVTTIPHAIARAVARACQEFIVIEEDLLTYVKSPNPDVAGFTKARKEMVDRIQALGKRLRSE